MIENDQFGTQIEERPPAYAFESALPSPIAAEDNLASDNFEAAIFKNE